MFAEYSNIKVSEIAQKLLGVKKCVIFTHTCPDGDALGAALALQRQMRILGKTADVAVDAPVPDCFYFLESMTEAHQKIASGGYDTYIAVDSAEPFVLGRFARNYTSFKGTTVNIDHHAYNTGYARINCVHPCSSCCQLITEIFRHAGWTPDPETANLLMLGLITDSGKFTHADVNERTFLAAAYLKAHGARPSEINDSIYLKTAGKTEYLLNKALGEGLNYYGGRLAVITVLNKDLEELGLDRSVTEGFAEFPLTMGCDASVFLKEQEGGGWYKAFLRSNAWDMKGIAESLGGAGTEHAACCIMKGSPESCRLKIAEAFSKYFPEQNTEPEV